MTRQTNDANNATEAMPERLSTAPPAGSETRVGSERLATITGSGSLPTEAERLVRGLLTVARSLRVSADLLEALVAEYRRLLAAGDGLASNSPRSNMEVGAPGCVGMGRGVV